MFIQSPIISCAAEHAGDFFNLFFHLKIWGSCINLLAVVSVEQIWIEYISLQLRKLWLFDPHLFVKSGALVSHLDATLSISAFLFMTCEILDLSFSVYVISNNRAILECRNPNSSYMLSDSIQCACMFHYSTHCMYYPTLFRPNWAWNQFFNNLSYFFFVWWDTIHFVIWLRSSFCYFVWNYE